MLVLIYGERLGGSVATVLCYLSLRAFLYIIIYKNYSV